MYTGELKAIFVQSSLTTNTPSYRRAFESTACLRYLSQLKTLHKVFEFAGNKL